jgi:hypothetical protein
VSGWFRENRIILLLTIAIFLVHVPFALGYGFLSDEAVYTYAAYAIGRGIVPYRGIALFQPPMGYMLLTLEVFLTGVNLLNLRLLNLLVFVIDVFLAYKVFKKIELVKGTAILAAAIFGLFPTIMNFSFQTPIEFLYVTAFAYLSFYLYVGHVTDKTDVRRLFVVGVCIGMAIMTWLVSLFILIALVTVDILGARVARRTLKDEVKRVLFTVGGSVVVGLVFLMVIVFVWGAYQQFMTQAVVFQAFTRSSISFSQKLSLANSTLDSISVLFALAACGIVILVRKSMRVRFESTIVPILLFSIPLVLVLIVPKMPFGQFYIFLVPMMSFLSAVPFTSLDFRKERRISVAALALFLIMIMSFSLLFGVGTVAVSQLGPSAIGRNDPYNLAERSVGSYVRNVTSDSDLIWTSEGAIAFFAGRLIVPDNSSMWPYQAMYNDMFPCDYVGTLGIVTPGLDLVNSSQFIQGWESPRVTLLVFIMGKGPATYPDEILWNGCPRMPGVSSWVEATFTRVANFTAPGVSYDYLIWVRNTNQLVKSDSEQQSVKATIAQVGLGSTETATTTADICPSNSILLAAEQYATTRPPSPPGSILSPFVGRDFFHGLLRADEVAK